MFKNFSFKPGSRVVSNEAVDHHDEGEHPSRDVLDGHHSPQPHPLVPLIKVDSTQKIEHRTSQFAQHAECQERSSSKLVTPAPDVEGKENGDKVFSQRSDVVEADILIINLTINCCILVFFYVGTKVFACSKLFL